MSYNPAILCVQNHQCLFGKILDGKMALNETGNIVQMAWNELQNARGKKLWQRNYWEHIIRNDESLQHIENYIINNSMNWGNDKFYYQDEN